MSSDNPTEFDPVPDDDIEEIRDIDAEKEIFIRNFMNRQRELHKKSLTAIANLATANMELILRSGINEVAAKRTRTATLTATNDVIGDLIKEQVKEQARQRADGNEQIVARIMKAVDIDVE